MSKTIEINGETYVKQTQAGDPPPYQIVVADRGWVYAGHVTTTDKGIVITNAQCIRRCGTDEKRPGIGYLAANGPTEKTVLEPSGVVRIHTHAIIATLDSDEEKWQ